MSVNAGYCSFPDCNCDRKTIDPFKCAAGLPDAPTEAPAQAAAPGGEVVAWLANWADSSGVFLARESAERAIGAHKDATITPLYAARPQADGVRADIMRASNEAVSLISICQPMGPALGNVVSRLKLIVEDLDRALQPVAADAVAQTAQHPSVLDEIGEALETRGYMHMTNGRDIGLLLDRLAALETTTKSDGRPCAGGMQMSATEGAITQRPAHPKDTISGGPIGPSEAKFIEAVRSGCAAADLHLACAYPHCKCISTPQIVPAAVNAWDAADTRPTRNIPGEA